ncbi:unnamed protein product [Hydatigera taeniaeformis]|uniref:4-hydroxy-tetrahydrodipicolinate synthase n=1 Tax=Hydatigena taeniaeformis TaxID=6205 RepID=A0A0R3WQX1_HYDTA|nr:unnamed protein product [Hydatigera taeniaeformis]
MNRPGLIAPLVRPGRCDSAVEEMEAERVKNVLQMTGAERIISNYLPGKLEESGWNAQMFEECCKWLKANTASGQRVYYGQKIREKFREPEDVDPQELVAPLTKMGMSLVPRELSTEVVEHIIKVIKENITN